jgi:hypothetical protein
MSEFNVIFFKFENATDEGERKIVDKVLREHDFEPYNGNPSLYTNLDNAPTEVDCCMAALDIGLPHAFSFLLMLRVASVTDLAPLLKGR